MTEEWKIGLDGDRLRVWSETRNEPLSGVADICINRSIDDNGPSKLEHDRAHLIATAPETAAERDRLKAINAELLEALITLWPIATGYYDGIWDDNPGVNELVDAAIAKATNPEG